jgi:ribonuclease T2
MSSRGAVRWRVAAIMAVSATVILSLAVSTGVAEARHHPRSQGDTGAPAVAGQFDYYLLSLSWSPSYCLIDRADRAQCGKGYGFVLHGLWPQDLSGGHPESCAPAAPLSPAAAARGRTLFPSPKLVQHEWERHGSCSGMDAPAYFETADRALAAVKIPPVFDSPRAAQSMSAAQIRSRFRAANPALPDGALAITCRRDELAEVRVCLGKDLAPISCGRGVRSSCPDLALQIPAAR